MITFSIIIPILNEKENIYNLLSEIQFYLNIDKFDYEIIIVDDNSNDLNSEDLLKLRSFKNTIVINNEKNLGQSMSIYKGISSSTYSIIVTLDGDGQNNPSDIIKLIEFYSTNNYKLVGGIRSKRKDSLIKIVSSKVANKIRELILNDDCTDTGCSLKVFDKKAFLEFPFFDSIHRFLPALFKGYGHKTFFLNVDHRPRIKGVSKYGTIDRLFKGIQDIFRVKKILKNK